MSLLVSLAVPVGAQDLPYPRTGLGGQQQPDPNKPVPLLGPNPADLLRDENPRSFWNTGRSTPVFQGFPTFPPQVPGFGGYPGGVLPVPFTGVAAGGLPPAPARLPDQWPSWFSGADGEGVEEFTPDVALVNQFAEGVWYRSADESAYVPLAIHDKFRVLRAGSAVAVPRSGSFRVTFNDGGGVRADGGARVELAALSEDVIELGVRELTRMALVAAERPMRLRFAPSGLVLEAMETRVDLELQDGVVQITNQSSGRAIVQVGSRQLEIPRAHRVRFPFAAEVDNPIGAGLQRSDALRTERDGRALRFDAAGGGGELTWSGARFTLPQDASLRLDPLAGNEFPTHRAGPDR